MQKRRLSAELTARKLVTTRSQAESWIKLGKVTVDGQIIKKSDLLVNDSSVIELKSREQYVSRAGLKLASVARSLRLDFKNKIVLDVGSSTGGFTDYALQHGAQKVYAVDVGTDQLHHSLRHDPRIDLHEKTDIREFSMPQTPDIIVIDVSFISIQDILPKIASFSSANTQVIAMVKPQFEASVAQLGRSGVVKNDTVRRRILAEFEQRSKVSFVIKAKADSAVAGASGNRERFYLLTKVIK